MKFPLEVQSRSDSRIVRRLPMCFIWFSCFAEFYFYNILIQDHLAYDGQSSMYYTGDIMPAENMATVRFDYAPNGRRTREFQVTIRKVRFRRLPDIPRPILKPCFCIRVIDFFWNLCLDPKYPVHPFPSFFVSVLFDQEYTWKVENCYLVVLAYEDCEHPPSTLNFCS